MRFIPTILLKQLYTRNSLKNTGNGIEFNIKNRLMDAQLTGIRSIKLDGKEIPMECIFVDSGEGEYLPVTQIHAANPVDLPLRKTITFVIAEESLPEGKHKIEIRFDSKPFGTLHLQAEDILLHTNGTSQERTGIPRDLSNDYSAEIIEKRKQYVEKQTSSRLEHVVNYSFDAREAEGNCENFTGVAQVPLGFAGPLQINGEYARGKFLIPLATTEGTLVASYNRGMKLLNACGGALCTVVEDAMQRAPVFVFKDARGARDFIQWINANLEAIREQAEGTSRFAKLLTIETYQSNKFAYLRFNFTTGDASGQNMVSKATFAACNWIVSEYEDVENFYLESNMATDKKPSFINTLHTRGKRVTAEVLIKRDILMQEMRVEPEKLQYHGQLANIGSRMAGTLNNGLHCVNGLTAMFIATGQDVACIAESSAAILHTEVTPEGDFYASITLPSLVIASYGGGTGLPTQRECLEVLGCYGTGNVNKLAEIMAGVVLAGELSLASAISSLDWVSSHEEFARKGEKVR